MGKKTTRRFSRGPSSRRRAPCAPASASRIKRVRPAVTGMREPLPIAVAQPLCVPYDVAANALAHAATVRAAGARLVVFPELSLTGYELDAPAITVEDARLGPIVEACGEVEALALVGA